MLRPPGELDRVSMNAAEMRRAAEATGGALFPLADAERVLEKLPLPALDECLKLVASPGVRYSEPLGCSRASSQGFGVPHPWACGIYQPPGTGRRRRTITP